MPKVRFQKQIKKKGQDWVKSYNSESQVNEVDLS